MSARTSRRALLGATGTGLLAALAGCSGSTPLVGRRIEERETISPGGAERLEITGTVGEVTVVGVDRDDITLDIVKQSSSIRTDLEDLEFRTETDGDTLELQSAYDGSVGWFESQPTMDLDVEVPETLAVERIDASIGRVRVRDVTGDLTVETSTGEIDVSSVEGTVGARASTGSVDIRDVEALGDVRTSTGRIAVDVPAIDGDTTIEASTGEIAAAIDPELDADLRVHTSVGEVSVDGLELTGETRADDLVTGTLGDGGPTLRLETSTGRISVTSLS